MGSFAHYRQRRRPFRPLVAFDFDGTLTARDSYRDFIKWRSGPRRWAAGLARLAPAVARYARDRDRGALKEALTAEFLAGMTREELAAAARAYATERSPRLLRPDAVACWRRWQAQNARLIICTATPDIIIAPFAHGLGAWRLIATRLAYDETDRVTGRFEGANCRGPEKARRLAEELGEGVRLEAAYGDTDGDIEMLEMAEEAGYRLFGLKPA